MDNKTIVKLKGLVFNPNSSFLGGDHSRYLKHADCGWVCLQHNPHGWSLVQMEKIRWEIHDEQVMIFSKKSIFKDKRFKGFKTHIIHKVKGTFKIKLHY